MDRTIRPVALRLLDGRFPGWPMRWLILAALLAALTGCGKDGVDTSRLTAEWQSHRSAHFLFHYPADSPRAGGIAEFSAECEGILAHVTRVLQVTADEPIDFFIFSTEAEGESLINRPPGFFEDGRIFWRIGQHPGGLIALAGCYLIDPGAESFDVLKTGMYQLYSQPSANVHAMTFGFERQNRFVPLVELGDPKTAEDLAVYSAEAASLCAYLLAKHGPERFKMLWRSVRGLTDSLEKIYRLEITRLESDWRAYYRKEASRT